MTREPNDFFDETEVMETSEESDDYARPVAENDRNQGMHETKSNFSKSEYDDFVFTRYHGRKKGILSHSGNHNTTRSYSAKNHFVREVRSGEKRHYRRKKWWNKLLIILALVLAGLIVLGAVSIGVFYFIKESGVSQLTGGDVQMTAPLIESANVSVDNSRNTITYNGTTYAYNNDMTSILCMGVDKKGMGLEDELVGTGGQADALYLVAMDTKTGKTTVIAISRDIYSDISVYSADGTYKGTENAQLCLAYAYGDGKETSCDNTVKAVERLFYNLPVNSYFAMDLSAIGELNDAIGGVYVTLEDDYLYYGMNYYGRAGDTVRLVGDYARAYLQYRDVNELNSSVDRMNRQINYLEKFAEKAIAKTKKDLSTPVTLYEIVKDYSVTNLNASKISAIGYTVATSGAEVEFKKVPGEVIHNGQYAEYVVDEQAMLELILDVYYEPVD